VAEDLYPPRRDEQLVDDKGLPTLRFAEYLERTVDVVNEIDIDIDIDVTSADITQSFALGSSLKRDIDRIEIENLARPVYERAFRSVSVSENYSARDHDFINAKKGKKITFPASPNSNHVIIVRNGDGSRITIDGNGKLINGEKSAILRNEGTALYFHYFDAEGEWFAR
jgi:hypothetical protein